MSKKGYVIEGVEFDGDWPRAFDMIGDGELVRIESQQGRNEAFIKVNFDKRFPLCLDAFDDIVVLAKVRESDKDQDDLVKLLLQCRHDLSSRGEPYDQDTIDWIDRALEGMK